ncbi:MAG: DNA alkylation repair protein [Cellulophaga sp.]
MAELFKNVFNQKFFTVFTKAVLQVTPGFNKDNFLNDIYDDEWENRELKQRMRHITVVLKNNLSDDFPKNASILLKIIEQLKKNQVKESSLEYMFFPDFIELYGLNYYSISVRAFKEITQFTSCEFAVRPFIIKYEAQMIAELFQWSTHENVHVRRLASEGCRPRLPWAMAIPYLKKDPTSILPILENLKNDPTLYVRRSVANNLNDIAKDNPNTVLQIAQQWKGANEEIDWLIKHACRTLLKEGGTAVMALFGFGAIDSIKIADFKIHTPKVAIGGVLEFSCKLINSGNSASKLRLEYGLYYQKANGSLSRKVFKISEKEYPEKSSTTLTRKQSFKVITTRKFHLGKHQLCLIINGNEFQKLDFELVEK